MKTRSGTESSTAAADGEFLWLVSLSDLMILLFVFFVALFAINQKKNEGLVGPRPLDQIQKKILKWVVDKKLLDSVTVTQKEDAIILQIKEQILFRRGDFKVRAEALDVLDGVGHALELIPPPFRIGIEGHADRTPARKNARFDDNWDLSTKRALSVLRSLDLDDEVLRRTVIMGYGSTRPYKSATAAVNEHLDRRVTIRIF